METPKNCWECQHSENCPAPYYGGSLCKYEDEIRDAALASWSEKKEDAPRD